MSNATANQMSSNLSVKMTAMTSPTRTRASRNPTPTLAERSCQTRENLHDVQLAKCIMSSRVLNTAVNLVMRATMRRAAAAPSDAGAKSSMENARGRTLYRSKGMGKCVSRPRHRLTCALTRVRTCSLKASSEPNQVWMLSRMITRSASLKHSADSTEKVASCWVSTFRTFMYLRTKWQLGTIPIAMRMYGNAALKMGSS
mmetsp:Transcript_44629/g.133248  ORF Transcript_44629/g.133248 Transcript_44629/m.133248 type:complete len:200 (+) Transcript_44629:281-880(+)